MTVNPAPLRRGAVVVGFDYGTHSTKLVLRERNAEQGSIVAIDDAPPGYSPGTCPSVVRIVDGRLLFGARAHGASGGELFRSLKASLLPGNETHAARLGGGRGADILVAAYMAWAIRRLYGRLTGLSQRRVLFNVARR